MTLLSFKVSDQAAQAMSEDTQLDTYEQFEVTLPRASKTLLLMLLYYLYMLVQLRRPLGGFFFLSVH